MAAKHAVSVLWGLTGKKISLEVAQGTTVRSLCERLASRQEVGSGAAVQLLAADRAEALLDSDVLDASGECCYRALLRALPKLHLAKHSAELPTTRALAKKMSSTGWHGHVDGEWADMIVREGCEVRGLSEQLPEGVRAKAAELQRLVEGIWLPGGESDFEGYAFVVDPGSEEDLQTTLSDAFGFLQEVRGEVTLEEKAWRQDFSCDERENEDEDQRERLRQATAILNAFGKTYEFNFTDDIICGPVLYFAQHPEDKMVLGVVGGRVWT